MVVHPTDLARLALAGALLYQMVFQLFLAHERDDRRFYFTAAWCLIGAATLGARFAMRTTDDPATAVMWTRVSVATLLALLPLAIAALHATLERSPPLATRAILLLTTIPVALALGSDRFLVDRAVRGHDLFGGEFWIAERGPLFALLYLTIPLALGACVYLIRAGGGLGGRVADRALVVAIVAVAAAGLLGTVLVRAGHPAPQGELGVVLVAWAFTYTFLRKETDRRLNLAAIGERRRQFIAASLAAQEREREHISREINDTLGQSMSGLLVELQAIERLDPAPARGRVSELRPRARAMLDDVRRTARRLHPAALTDLGLEQALLSNASEFESARDIEVDVHVRQQGPALPRMLELALYRMAQESLLALGRTGEPTSISVVVEIDLSRARLIIDSDGADASGAACKSLIDFAHDRIDVLGGSIEIESNDDGTAIFVTLPVELELSSGDALSFEASRPPRATGSVEPTDR